MSRPGALRTALLLLALTMVGCGGEASDGSATPGGTAAAPDGSAAPAELTPVVFRGDSPIDAKKLPWIVGIENGLFEQEGLDVTFQQGSGSADTVQQVAAGSVEFGYANISPVAYGAETGAPVIAVGAFGQPDRFRIYWKEGNIDPIETPQDLAGLTMGTPTGSAIAPLLRGFLEEQGLTDQVEVVQTSTLSAMHAGLAEGRLDAVASGHANIVDILAIDPEGSYGAMDLSPYGVELLGYVVITNRDYLDANPDIVEAFVRGTRASWEYILEDEAHVEEAIEIATAQFPEVPAEVFRDSWPLEVGDWQAPEGQVMGYFVPADVEASAATLANLEGKEQLDVPIEEIYTNDYLGE